MLAPQRWPDLRAELAQERLAPQPHRLRVVRADILDAVDDEGVARAGRDGGDEPRDGGQMAAGEYVADEVVGTGVGGVAGVGDRDALEDRHSAVALQQAVDAGEVGFKVCCADRLEHLDADDIAVGPCGRDLEVTVVGLLLGDSVRESYGPDALLGAERCSGYGAAGLLHGLDGEAAPAGADSRTWSVGLVCALSMKRCSLCLRASSSDSVAERGSDLGSHIGHEYVISGERKAANMSLLS